MSIRTKISKRYQYIAVLSVCFGIGLSPAILNYLVDPFEVFRKGIASKQLRETIEKSHYPLWKMTHAPQNIDTVILGDSRARSLRNKYWREGGRTNAYNFAYGGGTIPEIYSTFKHVTKDNNVNTLIVGIQLRSFDEKHKGGMNRVPEAVRVGGSKLEYLKNWFVTKTSLRIVNDRYPGISRLADALGQKLNNSAQAAPQSVRKIRSVDELLKPEVCFGCDLPEGGELVEPTHYTKGPNLGLGRGRHRWDRFTKYSQKERSLPKKFNRQVVKNAKSDWARFEFSDRYWRMIEEIGKWAKSDPDHRLIFVIPPTLTEMQSTITAYGLQDLNEQLRKRLALLAPVLDFDFANEMTGTTANFSDAYHFKSHVARMIVREALIVMSPKIPPGKKQQKSRKELFCPMHFKGKVRTTKVGKAIMKQGRGCRIWGAKTDA